MDRKANGYRDGHGRRGFGKHIMKKKLFETWSWHSKSGMNILNFVMVYKKDLSTIQIDYFLVRQKVGLCCKGCKFVPRETFDTGLMSI